MNTTTISRSSSVLVQTLIIGLVATLVLISSFSSNGCSPPTSYVWRTNPLASIQMELPSRQEDASSKQSVDLKPGVDSEQGIEKLEPCPNCQPGGSGCQLCDGSMKVNTKIVECWNLAKQRYSKQESPNSVGNGDPQGQPTIIQNGVPQRKQGILDDGNPQRQQGKQPTNRTAKANDKVVIDKQPQSKNVIPHQHSYIVPQRLTQPQLQPIYSYPSQPVYQSVQPTYQWRNCPPGSP